MLKNIAQAAAALVAGLLLSLAPACPADEKILGGLRITNEGRFAVVLNDPLLLADGETRYLGNRVTGDYLASLPGFVGYPDDLPSGSYELVWQLAEISDCADKGPLYSRDRYSDCTYTPIPGKKYRQLLDFDQLRSTTTYKNAGKPVLVQTGTTWFGLPRLRYERQKIRIQLTFRDNQASLRSSKTQSRYRLDKPGAWR